MANLHHLVRARVSAILIDMELEHARYETRIGGCHDVRSIGDYDRETLDGVVDLLPDTHPRASREQTSHVRRDGRWRLETVNAMDPDYLGAAMTVRRAPAADPRRAVAAYRDHANRPGVFRRENGRLVAIG